MFQLIVAVISIALVAALAIASIFYGGEAFNKSSEKSAVTALVNQGQQIHAAIQLYQADNGGSLSGLTSDLSALTDTTDGKAAYLATLPAVPSKIATGAWTYDATNKNIKVNLATGVDENSSACTEVTNQAGGGNRFYCAEAVDADPAYFGYAL